MKKKKIRAKTGNSITKNEILMSDLKTKAEH